MRDLIGSLGDGINPDIQIFVHIQNSKKDIIRSYNTTTTRKIILVQDFVSTKNFKLYYKIMEVK